MQARRAVGARGPAWRDLAVLGAVLAVAFLDVVAGGRTLLPVEPGVMPDGPYGYTGPRPLPAVYDPAASAIKYVPYMALVSRSWRRGEVPFWNPHNGAGVPLWANGETFAFAPLRLPLLIAPGPVMWDAWMLLRLWLAGVLTYALSRRLGLDRPASLGAGAAYMLGGTLVLSLNLMHLDVDVLLPGLLLALDVLLRDGGRRAFLATAGLAWAMALGGSPQALMVDGLAALIWAVARAPARAALGPAAWALVAGCAGALPHWVPFAELLGRARHLHVPGGLRGGDAAMSAAALPALLGGWAVPPGPWGLPAYYYSGVVVCALAAAGAILVWRSSPGRRKAGAVAPDVAAWRVLSLIVLAELWKVFGGPGAAMLGRLPGLDMIWWVKYAAPLGLGLALLAGYGLVRLGRRDARIRWVGAALICAELVALRPGPLAARHDPLAPAPYIGWLRDRLAADGGAWRVCGLGNVLMPNMAAAFGFPDVRLEDSLVDRDQYRLLYDGFAAPKPPHLGLFLTLDVLDLRRLESLRGLGVRWLLAPRDWRPAATVAPALSRAYDAEISIWRVAGARPFAGFPVRGRRAFGFGLLAGLVLTPMLLMAGLRTVGGRRRARSVR